MQREVIITSILKWHHFNNLIVSKILFATQSTVGTQAALPLRFTNIQTYQSIVFNISISIFNKSFKQVLDTIPDEFSIHLNVIHPCDSFSIKKGKKININIVLCKCLNDFNVSILLDKNGSFFLSVFFFFSGRKVSAHRCGRMPSFIVPGFQQRDFKFEGLKLFVINLLTIILPTFLWEIASVLSDWNLHNSL